MLTSPSRRPVRALTALALGLALALAGGASPAGATVSPLGLDVSYPQCEAPALLPASFLIVGVNGGLANNANPCLAAQLLLASAAPGLTRPAQPALSLYLDAADPGPSVPDWPPAGFAGVTP